MRKSALALRRSASRLPRTVHASHLPHLRESMDNDPVVIVGAARTPMGGFQGDFASLAASELGAVAIKAAVERAGIEPVRVDKTIFGCVLPAGQGQAPARQAALKAGLPVATGCTTVNKMCGSAMEATILAHDALVAGTADVMVAGGMESMSNAPYLMPKARGGYRMGHQQVLDHMFFDGLEDAYDKGRLMGTFAEDCAGKYAVHARGAGSLRADVALARAGREQRRHVRVGDRAGHGDRAQGRSRHRQGRAAGEGVAGQDSAAEAGVPQGRHGDGGQFELDLRRRRRARAHAPFGSGAARAEAARGDHRARDARTGTGVVLDGARRRDRKALPRRPAGRRATSTSSRSTRRSPWSRWRR